jgi:aminoglycoside phosphotransferase (APT) family kinase protein
MTSLSPALAGWLSDTLGDPGPFTLAPLSGGNSNETLLLHSPAATLVLRRPPPAAISASAHSMDRERRILGALAATTVPVPRPLGSCDDPTVSPTPVLVMEHVSGASLTDRWPAGHHGDPATVTAIGEAVIDGLVTLHTLDWRGLGLDGFGRPDGFLGRQVGRWRTQYTGYTVRELPLFDTLAQWLTAHLPPDAPPAIIHGDFHLDNCLIALEPPVRLAGIVDWEMSTIGDPLLDLGLFLALWGPERPLEPALPRLQAVTRIAGAPTRATLARRYAAATGRDLTHLPFYLVLALWKLGAIIEGAYAQLLRGELDSPYARALERDVPQLLREAASFAGLTP